MHFDFRKFTQAALFVAPILLPAFGVPAEAINIVVHGVLVAEHAANGSPKSGADKKAIALDAIKTGLEAVNAARPGSVNVDEVLSAADGGIDATVKGINAAKNIPAHTI
jgi:hypothetical protein